MLTKDQNLYKVCVHIHLFILQKVIDNGMGSKNNLVTVKMSDFEVFQALAKDSEGVHSSAQTEYSQVKYYPFPFYRSKRVNTLFSTQLALAYIQF